MKASPAPVELRHKVSSNQVSAATCSVLS
ncbi:unnamed protein product [Aureobasidium pullulans]|nr:unnamed protein product [Aureobasidium pullulans]